MLSFRFWACYGIAFGCFLTTQSPAQLLRVPNTTLQMPSSPPVYGYTSVNAFPGLLFTNPICIVSPPGETNRLFILSKNGLITVITNLAAPNETTFMDLTPQVSSQDANSSTYGERGLLGMAFHPGFATNGYFYILYMPTNPATSSYFDRLARFSVSPTNPNQGLTNSQIVIYDQVDPDPNHNSGDIHFGADGYLYISVGDEGKEHDGFDCAQIITNSLFSGILRIDVDKRPGNLQPNPSNASLFVSTNYLIPADNPFIGFTSFDGQSVNPNLVRTEFYAVGLRNPWRWNFDFHTNAFGTNVLYCGDVGQDNYEEVDAIQKGDNLGWAYWEGTNVASGGTLPHDLYIPTSGTNIRFPIVQYKHGTASNQGNCVIGGVVYRGSNLPQLYGDYVYADYTDGNIWTLVASNYTVDPTNVSGSSGPGTPIISDSSLNITAFGTDPRNGDVLFCATKTTGYATAATINKIIYNGTVTGAPLPPTLADTGAFTNLMSLTSAQDSLEPAPGIVPYTINVPFWSDNALKSRWISLPDTNQTIGFSPDSNWSFPTGTVWIKNFNLELTNGDPTSQIRLETRFIVRNSGGVYGVTYVWDSKTNAVLAPADGLDTNYIINDGGTIRTQTWHFPSQNECLTCHTPAGGYGLGFNTPQLNDENDYGFGPTNEIQALSAAGYFSSPVTNDPNTLLALAAATNTTASLEWRSRSFLQANCSQCHQPQGTAQQSSWDARIITPTALAGLINAPLVNNLGDNNNRVISPADPAHSVLLTRDAMRDLGDNPSIQMPPLDSYLVDSDATNVVTQWILSMTNMFWVGASPDPQTVAPGNSAAYSITFVPTPDFTSDVTLSVSNLPAGEGFGFNFSPATVSSMSTSSTLTITTSGTTPYGTYPLTVTGIGGGVTNTDTMALVVSPIVANPGPLLWTASGGDHNWSTILNWTNPSAGGNGPPGSTSTAIFNAVGDAVNTNSDTSYVNQNFTIAALQYVNYSASGTAYQTTDIPLGNILTVTNGLLVANTNTTANGGTANLWDAVIRGRGTLFLTNGGSLVVACQESANELTNTAILNMSGLATFVATNVSSIYVGVASQPVATTQNANNGTLILAQTNFIALAGTGSDNSFLVGSNGNNTTNCFVYLGQTNVIFADCVQVGSFKSAAAMTFQNGLNNPAAYFRNRDGVSRISLWGVGEEGLISAANGSSGCFGTNDFTGGVVNALINSLNVGVDGPGSTPAIGVLTFSAGTMDANTVTNGWSTAANTGNASGTINVNGSATLKANSSLVIAQTNGTTAVVAGTVNIHSGTILANSIVAGGGTSTINLTSGMLIVTNTVGAPTAPISAFGITNSTLGLNPSGTVTDIVVTAFSPGGTMNMLNIISLPIINNFPAQFCLIKYTGSPANLSTLTLGTIPGIYQGYLSNNVANGSVDLVVTNSSIQLFEPKADVWNGATNGFPNGNWDLTASNWISSAVPTNYANLTSTGYGDTVTFGDALSGTATVNLTTNLSPASITFTNNSTNYVFSGTGKISGPTALKALGAGKVTLTESGGDDFSGGILVGGGSLVLSNTDANISGGMTVTNGALTVAHIGTISGGLTLDNSEGGSPTASVVSSGTLAGNVTVNGGTAMLDQSGDISGNLTIASSGTVQIGNNDANGNLPDGTITDGGILIFDRNDTALSVENSPTGGVTNLISGSGALIMNGFGTVAFTNTISSGEPLTGPVIVNNGILEVGGHNSGGGFTHSSSLIINSGGTFKPINDNATIDGGPPITVNAGGTFSGVASADGGSGPNGHISKVLTLNGGTLTVNGNYTNDTSYGTWDLDGGVVVGPSLQSTNPLTGAFVTTNGTTSVIENGLDCVTEAGGTTFNVASVGAPNGIDLLVSAELANASHEHGNGFIKMGPGTMALDNNNTYEGNTTVSNGVLQLGMSGDTAALASPLSTGTVTLDTGGILNFGSSQGVTVGNVISDDGSGVVEVSSGTNYLTAANSYTGDTLVNGGTLALTGAGSIDDSASITVSNATLDVSGLSGVFDYPNALSLTNGTFNLSSNQATALSSLAISNSTLVLSVNGGTLITNIIVGNLTASGANTITIDSAVNVSGPVTFPLIAYNSFTGSVSGNFAKGTLPAGFSASLVDNAAQHRIDLVIAPIATVTPHFGAFSFAGADLIFSGSNGLPKGNYYVLVSTNVALPLNQWTRIATNPFDNNGDFTFTNPMSPNSAQLFYLLQLP